MNIDDQEGLISLLKEVSSMLENDPAYARHIQGFRLAMPDELLGFAFMLSDQDGGSCD